MGLIDRDYISEDRRKSAQYNPKEFRRHGHRVAGQGEGLRHAGLWLVILAIGFFSLYYWQKRTSANRQPSVATQRPEPFTPPATYTFPASGSARYYSRVDKSSLVASLKIAAEPGDASFRHVVRLRWASDKHLFVDLYLAPGQQIDVGLPEGDFEAVTFVGERWYGHEAMFGQGVPGRTMPNVFRSHPGTSFSISLGGPVRVSR